MTTNRPTIGKTFSLPDGPTGIVEHIEPGIEYGDPVLYVTVRSTLGNLVTRWVRTR
jgi:hypothetical protein